jgi:hypothetical protein
VLKSFPDWTSIYIAVPNIPSTVLREIARFAKVHLFNEQGDVLAVSRNLLSVHSLSGGKRTFMLPSSSEVIYDLFEKKEIAGGTDRFDVNLKPGSTALYFTGPKSLLDRLKK